MDGGSGQRVALRPVVDRALGAPLLKQTEVGADHVMSGG